MNVERDAVVEAEQGRAWDAYAPPSSWLLPFVHQEMWPNNSMDQTTRWDADVSSKMWLNDTPLRIHSNSFLFVSTPELVSRIQESIKE